jgi:hypothetical protein
MNNGMVATLAANSALRKLAAVNEMAKNHHAWGKILFSGFI